MSESVVLKASIKKYYIVGDDGIEAVVFAVMCDDYEVDVFDLYCEAERYIDTKLYERFLDFKGVNADA